MTTEPEKLEQIDLKTETDKPIIIYCHAQSNATININTANCHPDSNATVNINTINNYQPEWLDLNAALQILQEMKKGN